MDSVWKNEKKTGISTDYPSVIDHFQWSLVTGTLETNADIIMPVHTEMKEIHFTRVQSMFRLVFKEFEELDLFFLAATGNFRAVWAEYKIQRWASNRV